MTATKIPATVHRQEDGTMTLGAPEVGLWREGPRVGQVLRPGDRLGRVETLGRFRSLVVPVGASGVVVSVHGSELARPAVGYGTPLVVLDPSVGIAGASAEADGERAGATGLLLTAPMGGRFYLRAGPGKPTFVAVGDRIEHGQVVGLVEVMKTFNRIQYGGGELPSPARVKAVLRQDDEDISSGDPILEVEASE